MRAVAVVDVRITVAGNVTDGFHERIVAAQCFGGVREGQLAHNGVVDRVTERNKVEDFTDGIDREVATRHPNQRLNCALRPLTLTTDFKTSP